MKDKTTVHNEASEEIIADDPGGLLKTAREKRDLSPHDIAQRLNLNLATIQAIENNDFDKFANITFIRGYLRAYCHLVHVKEEKVLAQFEKIAKIKPQVIDFQSLSNRSSESEHNNRLTLVSYFIGIMILVLVVVWWLQRGGMESTNTYRIEQIEQTREDTVALNARQFPATKEIPIERAAPPKVKTSSTRQSISTNQEITTNTITTVEHTENAEVSNNKTTDVEAINLEDVSLTTNLENEEVASNTNIVKKNTLFDAQNLESSETNTASSTIETINDGQIQAENNFSNSDTRESGPGFNDIVPTNNKINDFSQPKDMVNLTLHFASDCWLQVKDAFGTPLITGTKNAGHVSSVQGFPPFQFTIGDLTRIERIEIDGKIISKPELPTGKTARFKLPIAE